MKAKLALALLLTLPGCALYGGGEMNRSVRLAKEAGGSGCLYLRGNSRPYADVSFLSVSTYGSRASYTECLSAIPPEAARMLSAPQ